MEAKLKNTIIISYLLLLIFIVLLNLHSGIASFSGISAFKLGNKTVYVQEIAGAQVFSEKDSIDKYSDLTEEISMMVVKDLDKNYYNKVYIDYLSMEEITEFDQLIEIFENDSSSTIVEKEVKGTRLYLKQAYFNDDSLYIFSMFDKCFPYFLRSRAIWYQDPRTPKTISEILKSIEVK